MGRFIGLMALVLSGLSGLASADKSLGAGSSSTFNRWEGDVTGDQ